MEYPVKIGYGRGTMATPRARPAPALVLASGSRYRRELLSRLIADFETVVPAVDETPQAEETSAARAQRLARLKTETLAAICRDAIVIGSDQVADLDGQTLDKPGTAARAVAQLVACSGRSLLLHTAVCVRRPGGFLRAHLDRTRLQFRSLTDEEAQRYVTRDEPYDCAGAFRFEGAGIALFSRVDTADPTAIQGLPLIWLAGCLTDLGVRVL